MNRSLRIVLLGAALLAGCGTSFAPFTREVRATQPLAECIFHASADIEFRSLRILETLDTTGFFKNDGHRYLRLAKEDPGKAVAQGGDWISVDFGKGIVLTFRQSGPEAIYVMPGWGTVTIREERYDIQVGVLSGKDIQLLWEPAPSASPSK